jgi:hypothetical protein
VGTARARIRWARLAAPARRALLGFCQTRTQLCCILRSPYRLASSPSLLLAPRIARSRRLRSHARTCAGPDPRPRDVPSSYALGLFTRPLPAPGSRFHHGAMRRRNVSPLGLRAVETREMILLLLYKDSAARRRKGAHRAVRRDGARATLFVTHPAQCKQRRQSSARVVVQYCKQAWFPPARVRLAASGGRLADRSASACARMEIGMYRWSGRTRTCMATIQEHSHCRKRACIQRCSLSQKVIEHAICSVALPTDSSGAFRVP